MPPLTTTPKSNAWSIALRRLFGLTRTADNPPSIARMPSGLCVYAIGDIHGQCGALDRLISLIESDAVRLREQDGLTSELVFLGDYIDRGPDSRGVLNRLRRLQTRGERGQGMACRFLLGNHEQAMMDFLENPATGAEWLAYGGAETLHSYGVRATVGTTDPGRHRAMRDALAQALPDEHRQFLDGLEPMIVQGDYVFVHAGIRPGRALANQKLEDLLWIREPFLSWSRPHEKIVVHGHTVVDAPELLSNRLGIDTGAYATGVLTAVALHGTSQRILQSGGGTLD